MKRSWGQPVKLRGNVTNNVTSSNGDTNGERCLRCSASMTKVTVAHFNTFSCQQTFWSRKMKGDGYTSIGYHYDPNMPKVLKQAGFDAKIDVTDRLWSSRIGARLTESAMHAAHEFGGSRSTWFRRMFVGKTQDQQVWFEDRVHIIFGASANSTNKAGILRAVQHLAHALQIEIDYPQFHTPAGKRAMQLRFTPDGVDLLRNGEDQPITRDLCHALTVEWTMMSREQKKCIDAIVYDAARNVVGGALGSWVDPSQWRLEEEHIQHELALRVRATNEASHG